MAPHCSSLSEQIDMSQDTSINELFSDDDDHLYDELPSLPVISIPQLLTTDHSLPQLLAQSCGTEDYHQLTSVQLKIVASQTSLQNLHIYIPSLVELDLTGSHLQSLRPLGYSLQNLHILRVGHCSLSSLDGVFGVSALVELHAPYNMVTELGLLATLPQLKILNLKRNLVENLHQVEYLMMCAGLRELTLAECPVTELPGYKASVISTLPKLCVLDGVLLVQKGQDWCQEGKSKSPDQSDEEDGATDLGLEITTDKIDETAEKPKLQRPATVCGSRSSHHAISCSLSERPATAAPNTLTPSITIMEDPDNLTDAVSKLTSGGVVCGNLAAALRGKNRHRKPAWIVQDADKEKIASKNGLNVTQLYAEIEEQVETERGAGDKRRPLLAASQQWREAYHSFRKAHREQWKNEEENGS